MYNSVIKRLGLLLFLYIPFLIPSFGQKKEYSFSHINTTNGLSNNNVVCLSEDRKGFIWIGSHIGLNKYDGQKVITYKNIPGDSTSVSGNIIRDILEDKDGNLWIATVGGLSKYNWRNDNFLQITANKNQSNSLASNNVETLYEDNKGEVWVGTDAGLHLLDKKTNTFTRFHLEKENNDPTKEKITDILEDKLGNFWIGTVGGVFLMNRNTGSFTHFEPFNDPALNLSLNFVECLFEDKDGEIWIGSKKGGLTRIDLRRNRFINYIHNPEKTESLGHNSILSLNEDVDGGIWIGTENGGLDIYDKILNVFNHNRMEENDPHGLMNNSIHAICRDHQNNLWVGTFSAGIAFYDWNKKKFHNFISKTCNPNSLSHNTVRRFVEDKDGKIWIATDGGGLNLFDPETNNFKSFKEETPGKNSIGGNHILSLVQDKEENLWGCCYAKGLFFMDRKTNKFTLYQNEPGNEKSLSGNETFDVYEDSYGYIWVGTYGSGLNRFDPKTKTFTRYFHDESNPYSLSSNIVLAILEDRRGNIWLGTEHNGLEKFDRKTGRFIHFPHDDSNPASISNNLVSSIFEDSKGGLWICTFGGLNYFDQKTGKFSTYREKEGLPNCNPRSVEEDAHGNLWIGTAEGIIKFSPDEKKSRVYKISDQGGDEIQLSASMKTKTEEMYFGGNSGMFVFHPDSIKDNPHVPPVYLKNFQIFNQPVRIGNESPLKENINMAKEIELSYNQSVFSFEFVALNFTSPEENQYAYKMEGFDQAWNVGKKNAATYTNLNPGEYTFRVRASNNDGVWNNKGTAVKIIITPPYWSTWWFKTLLTASVISFAFAFYKYRINKIKKQRVQLSIKNAELNMINDELVKSNTEVKEQRKILGAQNIELNKINNQLEKTNVELDNYVYRASHDLRAPLTSLLGLINLTKMDIDKDEKQKYLQLMERSIQKMDACICNILDYSRNSRITVEQNDIDFNRIIREVFDDLQYMEGAEGIIKEITVSQGKPFCSDPDRIKTILTNLVSNAIKYRNQLVDSRIKINIQCNEGYTKINVSDNGSGIREESIGKIFDMFYRASTASVGSGLGLYIVREVVETLKGTIEVKSTFGKGTSFEIVLPSLNEQETHPKSFASEEGLVKKGI
jgi:ligand-binding sensor domain-containing protein/signal transduction histidine kinase